MKRILIILLSLSAGCSLIEDGVPVGGGYKLLTVGGNTLLHQPPNVRLVYRIPEGKRISVWKFVVHSPRVIGDLAVFGAGLANDSHWKSYPALMAYAYPGEPVEITELITQKYCSEAGEEYRHFLGHYFYLIKSPENVTGKSIVLIGWRLPGNKDGPEHFDVSLSEDEILSWIPIVRAKGEKREYDGITYFIAKGDELVDGAKP